jgi:hypothetical protein
MNDEYAGMVLSICYYLICNAFSWTELNYPSNQFLRERVEGNFLKIIFIR